MPKNEWIPVEERLPEKAHDVLVTVIEDKWTYVSIDSYHASINCWMNNDYGVIAWMPLPEPYKVKEE